MPGAPRELGERRLAPQAQGSQLPAIAHAHLHIAWRRDDAPQRIRDFGAELSVFVTSRRLPYTRTMEESGADHR
ncbi:MAG: hypothetical protein JJE50_15950 [Actinomycetales bacterium]|nr:hypothetical protein [Actinomycetales bacterium]